MDTPLLIVNPSSGSLRGSRAVARFGAAVERALGDVDIELTQRRGHAVELARHGAAAGRRTIVAVGGDGTLSEVVNGVMAAGASGGAGEPEPPAAPRVGLIGLGTGGDFGRGLGMGRRLGDHLAVIAAGHTRAVDLLHVAFRDHDGGPVERYVVNVLSAGPGSLVDRYVERLPGLVGGRLSYGLAAAWALVRTPRARLRLRLWDEPGGEAVAERELDTWVLGVCNGPVFGGGMRLAPGALVDDGLIDVVSIGPARRRTVARYLPSVYRGRHVLVPGVEVLRCRALEVELLAPADPERFALDVDGDALGKLPLRARLVPGALTVLAPPDAGAPR